MQSPRPGPGPGPGPGQDAAAAGFYSTLTTTSGPPSSSSTPSPLGAYPAVPLLPTASSPLYRFPGHEPATDFSLPVQAAFHVEGGGAFSFTHAPRKVSFPSSSPIVPPYGTTPACQGAFHPATPASSLCLSFGTTYQPSSVHSPRMRTATELSRPDEFCTHHQTDSPASTGESVSVTPHQISFASRLSGTPSTVPTPGSTSSPESSGEGESSQLANMNFPSPELPQQPSTSLILPPAAIYSGIDSGFATTRTEEPPVEHIAQVYGSVKCWGVDNGSIDLDIGKNDDGNALSEAPAAVARGQVFPFEIGLNEHDTHHILSLGRRSSAPYYSEPVHVFIPSSLGQLPAKLLQSKINLLYFHHFLDHTARVLVPHDDPNSNPFRTVLPRMALENDNLLNLLLAYSAAHRARHLGQPEPKTRIAMFVEDIIPALRQMVDSVVQNPDIVISTADLATAIMLASLEIISPASLGRVNSQTSMPRVSIPWQGHLCLAREIIAHRPGGLRRSWSDRQEDQACAFLWSWFAYLDVLGSLSGGRDQHCCGAVSCNHRILDYTHVERERDGSDDADQIDCIMGFTPRCVSILAKVAKLARTCDSSRIDPQTRTIRSDWIPDAHTVTEAMELQVAIQSSLAIPSRPCGHVHATSDVVRWDREQMAATNEAYHWAALIHLHRRVLGRPSDHEDVRGPVGKIVGCLENIQHGSTAETCLLFPMFTAGCEITDAGARQMILHRVKTVEKSGMMQVSSYSLAPAT